MPFLTDLDIRAIRKTDNYKLLTALVFISNKYKTSFIASAGFITDFASIPKALRSFVDNDEADLRDASVIHDSLYASKEVSREVADNVLYEAMVDLGANKYKAYLVFLSVRIFGAGHYDVEL